MQEYYNKAMKLCLDKMTQRSNYGDNVDPLKSIKELEIPDIASVIKAKAIRIKNTDDKDIIIDNAIDLLNYAIEILRRVEL